MVRVFRRGSAATGVHHGAPGAPTTGLRKERVRPGAGFSAECPGRAEATAGNHSTSTAAMWPATRAF